MNEQREGSPFSNKETGEPSHYQLTFDPIKNLQRLHILPLIRNRVLSLAYSLKQMLKDPLDLKNRYGF